MQQPRREQEAQNGKPIAVRGAPSAAIAPSWLAASLGDAFSAAPALTVGLEEELILVDADSLLPVDAIEPVLALVNGDERFTAELRASQVELRTPICVTVADACRELSSARRRLLALLTGGVRLLAVGTHPVAAGPIVVTERDRYQRIACEWGWATRRGHPSGLHVHVGVGDPGEALAVYNAGRSYLPEIAALAANSPFFEGTDSGLASTRLKLTEDWPRAGVPPVFASWRKLAEFAVWARSGDTPADLSHLWWDLRPRPDYGTLEFRVADTQLTPIDAGAIAAFCQTLVAALADRWRRGQPLPIHETHLLSENRWRALRDGVEGALIDPDSGRYEPTRERIARLLVELEPHADELGCARQLGHVRAMLDVNGAIRQRAAAEAGIGGLLAWLADATERVADKPPHRSGEPDPWAPMPAESVAESAGLIGAFARPASAVGTGGTLTGDAERGRVAGLEVPRGGQEAPSSIGPWRRWALGQRARRRTPRT